MLQFISNNKPIGSAAAKEVSNVAGRSGDGGGKCSGGTFPTVKSAPIHEGNQPK